MNEAGRAQIVSQIAALKTSMARAPPAVRPMMAQSLSKLQWQLGGIDAAKPTVTIDISKLPKAPTYKPPGYTMPTVAAEFEQRYAGMPPPEVLRPPIPTPKPPVVTKPAVITKPPTITIDVSKLPTTPVITPTPGEPEVTTLPKLAGPINTQIVEQFSELRKDPNLWTTGNWETYNAAVKSVAEAREATIWRDVAAGIERRGELPDTEWLESKLENIKNSEPRMDDLGGKIGEYNAVVESHNDEVEKFATAFDKLKSSLDRVDRLNALLVKNRATKSERLDAVIEELKRLELAATTPQKRDAYEKYYNETYIPTYELTKKFEEKAVNDLNKIIEEFNTAREDLISQQSRLDARAGNLQTYQKNANAYSIELDSLLKDVDEYNAKVGVLNKYLGVKDRLAKYHYDRSLIKSIQDFQKSNPIGYVLGEVFYYLPMAVVATPLRWIGVAPPGVIGVGIGAGVAGITGGLGWSEEETKVMSEQVDYLVQHPGYAIGSIIGDIIGMGVVGKAVGWGAGKVRAIYSAAARQLPRGLQLNIITKNPKMASWLGLSEKMVKVRPAVLSSKVRDGWVELAKQGETGIGKIGLAVGEKFKPAPRWLVPGWMERLMPSSIKIKFYSLQSIRKAAKAGYISQSAYDAMMANLPKHALTYVSKWAGPLHTQGILAMRYGPKGVTVYAIGQQSERFALSVGLHSPTVAGVSEVITQLAKGATKVPFVFADTFLSQLATYTAGFAVRTGVGTIADIIAPTREIVRPVVGVKTREELLRGAKVAEIERIREEAEIGEEEIPEKVETVDDIAKIMGAQTEIVKGAIGDVWRDIQVIPVVTPKPVVVPKPVVTPKPVVAPKPVVTPKPVIREKPKIDRGILFREAPIVREKAIVTDVTKIFQASAAGVAQIQAQTQKTMQQTMQQIMQPVPLRVPHRVPPIIPFGISLKKWKELPLAERRRLWEIWRRRYFPIGLPELFGGIVAGFQRPAVRGGQVAQGNAAITELNRLIGVTQSPRPRKGNKRQQAKHQRSSLEHIWSGG